MDNNLDFFYQTIFIIEELNRKKRKIRSIRGFLLYALEIINSKEVKVLKTNLQPFSWKNVKNIIRQNKKDLLLKFLFKTAKPSTKISYSLEERIAKMQTEISYLKQEIKYLKEKKR